MTEAKDQPRGSDRWSDPQFEIVDDVPDAQQGAGMTPDEIREFLDQPIEPREGQ